MEFLNKYTYQILTIFILLFLILYILSQLLKSMDFSKSLKNYLKALDKKILRLEDLNKVLIDNLQISIFSYYSLKDSRIEIEENLNKQDKTILLSENVLDNPNVNYEKELKELLKIQGVGEVLAKRILKVFGSIQNIKSSEKHLLLSINSIGTKLADKIYSHLINIT